MTGILERRARQATWSAAWAGLLVLAACSGEPTASTGPASDSTSVAAVPTASAGLNGSNCVLGGDFSGDETFQVDQCALADNGFPSTDVTADFQFTDRPIVVFPGQREVYFVHEVRHTAGGSGYRLASAVFAPNQFVTTGVFGLRLLRELEASGFEAFIGGCPTSYSDPSACALWAFQNSAWHDEPRLCIWNAIVGAGGGAVAYCDPKLWGSLTTNRLPVAQFIAGELSHSGTSATWRFNASASSDPEGQALSYRWEFSDGFVATTSNPVYDRTFTAAGGYGVRLRVTEAAGGLDAQSQSISVTFNQSPVANFTFSCSLLTCWFTDQSYDPDGSVVAWAWAFGDGTTSTARNPGHTFPSAGTYNVRLTVTDNQGATGVRTKPVTVNEAALSVTISGATETSPNTVCWWFADATGGNGSYTYEWFRNGQPVGNAYLYEGDTGAWSFTLMARVTSGGQTAEHSLFVTVLDTPYYLPC